MIIQNHAHLSSICFDTLLLVFFNFETAICHIYYIAISHTWILSSFILVGLRSHKLERWNLFPSFILFWKLRQSVFKTELLSRQFPFPLVQPPISHACSGSGFKPSQWAEGTLVLTRANWKGQQKLQNGRYVWVEFFIAMAHCLLRAFDLLSIRVVVLHLPTQ